MKVKWYNTDMKLTQDQLSKIKDYFSLQLDISLVYLYGSFAYGGPHQRSDIDFGILFNKKPDYHRLGQVNSELSDLHLPSEPEAREIHLNQSPLFLRNVARGVCVYAQDEIQRIRFEVKVMNLFRDSEKLRELRYYYLNKRLQDKTYGY